MPETSFPLRRGTLVVVTGPTAVGKTSLSVRLAAHFHTSVISADSRQFYKEMKIGTAAPTHEELAVVPHFFAGNLFIFKFSITSSEQTTLFVPFSMFEEKT